MIKRFAQPLRFLVSGGFSTGVHWLVMSLLVLAGLTAEVSTAVGALVGALVNYQLQHRFAFRSNREHRSAFTRYVIACVVNWVTNLLLFTALHRLTGLSVAPAQVLTSAIIAILSYTLYKRLVFNEPSSTPSGN